MPFKSKAQMRYLYANNPKVAEEFQKHTPEGKKLPNHVPPKKFKSPSKKTRTTKG